MYVSYYSLGESVDDAHYRVHHAGGITEFSVNQQMGGGTWIYLGKFHFERWFKSGASERLCLPMKAGIEKRWSLPMLSGSAAGWEILSVTGLTGMRPRYHEAARYYLQYAGFPDSLVWKLNSPEADYKDDYQSRGEWVSYLMGAPSGPSANKSAAGLGIPVDLSFAFHTDAGITGSDTVIGTLGIFSTNYRKGPFPFGTFKNGLTRPGRSDPDAGCG